MIKRILLGAGVILGTLSTFAQNANHVCATDEHYRQQLAANPELQEMERKFAEYWAEYKKSEAFKQASNGSLAKASNPKYIVPVVVHVFYGPANSANNISDAQVQSEIDFLNLSFRNLNSDTPNRRAGIFKGQPFDFKALAADAQIEFRLARKDPNGNCTNGIVRVQTSDAENGNDNLKRVSVWDTKRYFNIWVVGKINRGPGISVAGYAQFPFFAGGAWSALTDGIMVINNEFGNIGTSNPGQTPNVTTSTHEAGHWFGLFHPFQGDSCSLDNDQVDDTPPTYFNPTQTEPLRNRCNNPEFNSCATEQGVSPFIDYPDMQENYMDYFIGSCASNMFTHQQVARMHFCIDNYRRQLVSQENLISTGVLEATTPCAPIPAFGISSGTTTAYNFRACVGTQLNFVDLSYNGNITSYEWNFGEGATPQTSNVKNPQNVSYSTPGVKAVTLKVTNANGSNTKVFSQAVNIIQPTPITYNAFLPDYPRTEDGWELISEDDVKWQLSSEGTFKGYNSIMLPGSNTSTIGNEYSVVTPAFDFTGASNPYFKFSYSFAQNVIGTSNSTDEMAVQVSTNCGLTWTNLQSPKTGAALATISAPLATSVNYVPVNASQWKELSVTPTAIPKASNVRFRVLFTNGGGNNFYLDDFQFGKKVGLTELTAKDISLNVAPNPFSTSAVISYELPKASETTVEVFDIVGKKVATLFSGMQSEGAQQVNFDRTSFGLTNGMYFIKIQVNGSAVSQKVLIN